MIKQINIRNFLTIKETDILLNDKLNVITGESGTGKSLILKAINEIFSSKNSTGMIGSFNDASYLSIVFSANLSKYGFSGNEFTLQKILRKNNSQIFLNNKAINLKMISAIREEILNIVSQDYKYELFEKDRFLSVIDMLIDREALNQYEKAFKDYQILLNEIKQTKNSIEAISLKHPEILLEQIEKYNPRSNEYDELINKRNQIKQHIVIRDLLNLINEAFFESKNAFESVTLSVLKKIGNFSFEEAETLRNSLNKILDELTLIKPVVNNKEIDETSIDDVEKRLFELESLQRKFGKSIDDIIKEKAHLQQLVKEKYILQEKFNKLEHTLKEEFDILKKQADFLTNARKEMARHLIEIVGQGMKHLLLENAKFDIVFEKVSFNINGQDRLRLLFSANKDLKMKELSKVASGGEKSRFILALVSSLVSNKKQTIIFDEVEEGTGGKTLDVIVSVIKKISLQNQIICITHSQELSNVSDNLIRIEKKYENGFTQTYLCH